MPGLFDRLFGRRDQSPAPETALSEEQASRIANAAATAFRTAPNLVLQGVRVTSGRLTWHYWTPTRGSGLAVAVDDVTGEAHVTQRIGR